MKFRNIFLLILFVFSAALIKAQEIQTKSYSISNGLVQNQVNTIIQDNHGKMWFGTIEGLSVYDGSSFRSVTIHNSRMQSNYINCSFFDKKSNRIWFGTLDNGLFSIREDTIADVLPYSQQSKLRRINDIHRFADKKLLLATNYGIAILDTEKLTAKFIHLNIIDNRINAFARLNNNLFALGTLSGIAITDSAFNLIYWLDERSGLSSNFIHDLLAIDEKNLLVASRKGLSKINFSPHPSIHNYYNKVDFPHPFVNVLFRSSFGTIWAGTGQGVLQFEGDQIKHIRLKDYFYKCIYQDIEGNIWFGARGAGLLKLRDEMFVNYNLSDGLPNQEILSIYPEPGGKVWYGTNKGVFSINKGMIESYSISHKTFANIVTDFTRFQGRLYLTTWDGLYRKSGSGFKRIYPPANSTKYKRLSLLTSFDGHLWICDRYHVYTLDHDQLLEKHIFQKGKISDMRLLQNATKLVLAGDRQFAIVDKKRKIKILPIPDQTEVLSIIPIDQQSFYLGADKGLYFFNGDSLAKISSKSNGLDQYQILSGAFDNKKQLWLGTNTGLLKFYENKVKKYAAYSGIIADEIITNRSLSADYSGNIHIGTFVGLSICYPEKEIVNRIPPDIRISEIELPDRKLSPATEGVNLNYLDNTITFHFAGISFRDETQIKYQFRLWGLDSTWSKPGHSNSAKFFKLPYEKFRFEVRAINGDNVFSKIPARFSFRVLPPFYLTTWFIFLFLSFSILISFFGYRRHINKIKRENVRLDQLVQDRTAELQLEKDKLLKINAQLDTRTKELSDLIIELQKTQDQLIQSEKLASLGNLIKGIIEEINNPLTYVFTNTYHINQYITQMEKFFSELKEKTAKNQALADLLEKFDVSYIIEDIKQIISGFDITLSRVINILENLTKYGSAPGIKETVDIKGELESAAYQVQKQFPDIGIEISLTSENLPIIMGSAQQLAEAFFAIVQNAAEATNGIGKIDIETRVDDHRLKIRFSDNGPGVPAEFTDKIFDPFFTSSKDVKKIGLGLSIAMSIITQHNGKLFLEDKTKNGAAFSIEFEA